MQIQDELPKSRITLRYPTNIDGVKKNKELPLRLLFLGDLSKGSTNERKLNLEDRTVKNFSTKGIDCLLKDLNLKLDLKVINRIDSKNSKNIDVNLDINSIKSFSPESIAENVPKIQSLMLIKKLLLELLSLVDNKKEFKKVISEIFSDKNKLKKLQEKLSEYKNLDVSL